jgi:hypothetical protein
MLHEASAASVWKSARLNTLIYKFIQVPPPPSGVAESHWAALLLGRRNCWVCDPFYTLRELKLTYGHESRATLLPMSVILSSLFYVACAWTV